MSIPDQSIECQNPNCGWCLNAERERPVPAPKAPTPRHSWTGKAWSEFGFQTFEQYENRLEWERTARDVCGCRHMRQEHGPACMHTSSRPKYLGYRLQCECTAWTAPQHAPDSTQAAQEAANRGLDAERGTA